MKVLIGLLFLCVISYSAALNVSQCHDIATPIDNLNDKVKVGNCKKPPCRLRRNTSIKVELKIKPEKDVEKLLNSIHCYIVGIPFPFPGYDQTDACNDIYTPDGKDKAGCPLKAGQDYLYQKVIDVLQIYPRIKTVVHWGLTQEDGTDLLCFEIPARITN